MDDVLIVLLVVVGALLATLLVLTVVVGVRLWRLRAFLHDPNAPLAAKVAFWGGLLYAVSPVDLVPDPVYLDDLVVLALAAAVVTSMVKRHQLSPDGAGPSPRAPGQGRVVPGDVVAGGIKGEDVAGGDVQDVQDTPGWRTR